MGKRILALLALNLVLVSLFGYLARPYVRDNGPDMVSLELSFRAGVFEQITGMWTEAGKTDSATRANNSQIRTRTSVLPSAISSRARSHSYALPQTTRLSTYRTSAAS